MKLTKLTGEQQYIMDLICQPGMDNTWADLFCYTANFTDDMGWSVMPCDTPGADGFYATAGFSICCPHGCCFVGADGNVLYSHEEALTWALEIFDAMEEEDNERKGKFMMDLFAEVWTGEGDYDVNDGEAYDDAYNEAYEHWVCREEDFIDERWEQHKKLYEVYRP